LTQEFSQYPAIALLHADLSNHAAPFGKSPVIEITLVKKTQRCVSCSWNRWVNLTSRKEIIEPLPALKIGAGESMVPIWFGIPISIPNVASVDEAGPPALRFQNVAQDPCDWSHGRKLGIHSILRSEGMRP
jgi:hypothetical protein